MSKVYSFSVGEGDMFCINHNSDNFTTIDCCLDYDDESKAAKNHVLNTIEVESKGKNVCRFISTHPDEDHISGLKEFHEKFTILNFYRVDNCASKGDKEESNDFKLYKQLRDDNQKNFSLVKDCTRRWMNQSSEERGASGLFCLWPDATNKQYIAAQEEASNGKPNNISPVIEYKVDDFSFLWMGDMETIMQKEFAKTLSNHKVTVVFAPHHGRKSGHIPAELMQKLSPNLVVVGEAPAEDLDYYKGQNTMTQNSAGDILFETNGDYLDIFIGNNNYTKKDGMVTHEGHLNHESMKYIGSIKK